jgi:hypothetical protein
MAAEATTSHKNLIGGLQTKQMEGDHEAAPGRPSEQWREILTRVSS